MRNVENVVPGKGFTAVAQQLCFLTAFSISLGHLQGEAVGIDGCLELQAGTKSVEQQAHSITNSQIGELALMAASQTLETRRDQPALPPSACVRAS